MADQPDYLNQSEEQIRQRMLDTLPSDLDKTEGSYIWDAIAPAALELFFVSLMGQDVLNKGFASTAASQISGFRSPYLDLRANEHGVWRIDAVKAFRENGLKITGTPGLTIQAGEITAGTPADKAANIPSIEFTNTSAVTLDAQGNGYADIQAVEGGTSGNVSAGAISVIIRAPDGVTGVTNPDPIGGGLEIEDDLSYLARYLQRVRNPSFSGNRADYIAWAKEVAGVGGVSVVPVRDGPGTVSVTILGPDMGPADQALVDTVQNYIAPPYDLPQEAETMTISGHGVSIDATQTDDNGDSIKMIYDAAGTGMLSFRPEALLPQIGIWQARVLLKASDITGNSDLLELGVWNISGNAWCKTTPAGSNDAHVILKANALALAFTEKIVEFYWNGQDQIEFRATRLSADQTTIVWIDQVIFHSAFSTQTGDGKAPVGARVTVEPAKAVLINVSANLLISDGYDADSAKSAATENIRAYLKSLAFAKDNDVKYNKIGDIIFNTAGINDYTDLQVNGGAANIPISEQSVAVLGVVTFTP